MTLRFLYSEYIIIWFYLSAVEAVKNKIVKSNQSTTTTNHFMPLYQTSTVWTEKHITQLLPWVHL